MRDCQVEEEIKHPSLKHNRALHEPSLKFGVPSRLFLLCCALVIIVLVTAGFVAALVAFLLTIPPAIIIHRDDEKALEILLDKLRRPTFYTGGVNEKTFKVLLKNRNKYITKHISQIQ